MKQIEKKLNALENEINELKIVVMQHNNTKKKTSLKGLLKGAKIEDSAVETSKKSLFRSGA